MIQQRFESIEGRKRDQKSESFFRPYNSRNRSSIVILITWIPLKVCFVA